ncbi:lipoyl(octanoyl) transferase LipB [Naumannella halotolerans]|uniref:Octanoyltransferase n=1 Tax=Naumannella halotolerans TaxID=993414 RepID=A0A4R7J884_9ACTN|nr:lipoyl(octanoyl) transferase LipB [Naumannella halotolerans]TDT32727.1 lipoyl(octanoyl) transferase [Naumannella halotolerans]
MTLEFPDLGIERGELTDYQSAWQLQREIHAQVAAGERGPTVLLVQHPSVYTAGKRTQPQDLPFDGTPVIDVDRGGKITWHGPGQLVAYPIVRLNESVRVVDYVRRLEQAMLDTLADLDLDATRVEGRSGVWILGDGIGPDRKLGQVGIRVAANTTMHGLAINVDPDMRWFANMIPCGISDAAVTSIGQELRRPVEVAEVAPLLTTHLRTALAFAEHDPAGAVRTDTAHAVG